MRQQILNLRFSIAMGKRECISVLATGPALYFENADRLLPTSATSVADLAAPAFAHTLSPHIMDPTLIGESALALWLLAFGARRSIRNS